jgi:hypothetical protein
MVDSMANSVEDYLIDGLSFKLNPGASYVSDRRSVSYFPAGSNIYQSGSGARVIRMNLTGEGWLDPSTVRLTYTLVNNETTEAKYLRVISGPWGFFRRARCLVGGAIVDDIDYYNRVHEMLHILTSKPNRDNDSVEGFGHRWDDDVMYKNWTTSTAITQSASIKGGSSRSVSFKPLFGLLNQQKYIPLMWSPLMFEFEVVNGATDAIAGTNAGLAYTDANTSKSWQIQDVRIVCDLVTLDSALQNSYAEHVLSGKALPINYGSYITQFQTITSADFAVSVTRAVSRLKSVFITFDGTHPDDSAATQNSHLWHRTFNTFISSMSDNTFFANKYDYGKELQWQLQIGSKMFPEYPCRSMAETFYQLKKALGIHGSSYHSLSINAEQYINDHFIIGVDTEKILEAGFTGLNTKAGDLMVLRGKGSNANMTTAWASNVYIVLHTDMILEIRDVGAQVFD